jgi:hypothetical protein
MQKWFVRHRWDEFCEFFPAMAEKGFQMLDATVMGQQQEFDAETALAEIRAFRSAAKRRRTWGKSRLVKHRAELVKLRKAGASFADLAIWLRRKKRIVVNRSTVLRFFKRIQNG